MRMGRSLMTKVRCYDGTVPLTQRNRARTNAGEGTGKAPCKRVGTRRSSQSQSPNYSLHGAAAALPTAWAAIAALVLAAHALVELVVLAVLFPVLGRLYWQVVRLEV